MASFCFPMGTTHERLYIYFIYNTDSTERKSNQKTRIAFAFSFALAWLPFNLTVPHFIRRANALRDRRCENAYKPLIEMSF